MYVLFYKKNKISKSKIHLFFTPAFERPAMGFDVHQSFVCVRILYVPGLAQAGKPAHLYSQFLSLSSGLAGLGILFELVYEKTLH
jgi:hypothetical protein